MYPEGKKCIAGETDTQTDRQTEGFTIHFAGYRQMRNVNIEVRQYKIAAETHQKNFILLTEGKLNH